MSGGAGRALPANRAAQGAAGAAPAARSLARREVGAARAALSPPSHMGRVDRQSRTRRHDRCRPVDAAGAEHGLRRAESGEAESATLEDSLQRYDTDGRVLSGHAAAVVADLEDRISILDGTLVQREQSAQDAELLQLWQERVGLMRELINARATRARYVGL